MTDPVKFDEAERAARRAAVAGGVLAAAAACVWPAAAVPALRFAAVACFQPAVGCLIFLLIYHLTGGQWGDSMRGALASGTRLVPWIWPLLGVIEVIRISRPDLSLPAGAAPMPGPWVLGARAVVYEVILMLLTRVAVRPRCARYSGIALVGLLLGGHFLAADTFFVLEPGWYSTGFPVVWLSISATSGFAVAIIAAAAAGKRPQDSGAAERPLGVDWGNLLLTTVVFSTYVAFMEFLVIWSGNLPREVIWFHRRSQGGWGVVTVLLVCTHLALPFLLLLSRRVKLSSRGLPRIARLVCLAEVIWAAWLVLPAFADRGRMLVPISLACVIGGGGLFAIGYVRGCRRELAP